MSPAAVGARCGSALVVGAGVSGLTTAIGLIRAGWHVDVEDRGSALDTRGAALGLWPHAWRGLAQLGVTDQLADPVPYTRASIRSASGRRIGSLPLGLIERRQGLPVMLVTRPALMHALTATYATCSDHPVAFHRVFTPDRDLSGYDLVVGADGLHSSVRRCMPGDPVQPRALGATAWRGCAPGSADEWGEIWGNGVFAGLTPAGKDRTNWYVALSHRHQAGDLHQLRQRVHQWPPTIRHAIEHTEDTDILRHELFDLPPLRSYTHGKTVLVGDAAHAMAPSLGQGACQAVMDALALTRAVTAPGDLGQSLAGYDATQRPAGTRLVRRSRQLLNLQLARRGARARNAAMLLLRPLAPG